MQTLTFAKNDQMPILGLGTWKAEPGEVGKAIRQAIGIGYRHIDCASIYGNEAEIGEALEEAIQEGDVSREELWITSKLWNNAHARDQAIGDPLVVDLGFDVSSKHADRTAFWNPWSRIRPAIPTLATPIISARPSLWAKDAAVSCTCAVVRGTHRYWIPKPQGIACVVAMAIGEDRVRRTVTTRAYEPRNNAAARADWTAGRRSETSNAIIAITTSSSTSVKPIRMLAELDRIDLKNCRLQRSFLNIFLSSWS